MFWDIHGIKAPIYLESAHCRQARIEIGIPGEVKSKPLYFDESLYIDCKGLWLVGW